MRDRSEIPIGLRVIQNSDCLYSDKAGPSYNPKRTTEHSRWPCSPGTRCRVCCQTRSGPELYPRALPGSWSTSCWLTCPRPAIMRCRISYRKACPCFKPAQNRSTKTIGKISELFLHGHFKGSFPENFHSKKVCSLPENFKNVSALSLGNEVIPTWPSQPFHWVSSSSTGVSGAMQPIHTNLLRK